MTDPDDTTDANLEAILAAPIEEWPSDEQLSGSLGISPVIIRQGKRAARRQRPQSPSSLATEPSPATPAEAQQREQELRDYLSTILVGEWQLPRWLASHFQVSEVFVRQEMRLAHTTMRTRFEANL